MAHLLEYENSPAIGDLYFFLPLFYYIYYNNGKAGSSLRGDAVGEDASPGLGLGNLSVLIVCDFDFTGSLNHYTWMQCNPAFKNLQGKDAR